MIKAMMEKSRRGCPCREKAPVAGRAFMESTVEVPSGAAS